MYFLFVTYHRKNLFEEAGEYFDKETGVLEAPMIIRVADQVCHLITLCYGQL